LLPSFDEASARRVEWKITSCICQPGSYRGGTEFRAVGPASRSLPGLLGRWRYHAAASLNATTAGEPVGRVSTPWADAVYGDGGAGLVALHLLL
jgi:hypothetical protein